MITLPLYAEARTWPIASVLADEHWELQLQENSTLLRKRF